ncbi:glycosyltransferase [Lactiplantibacillus plantarum]|uniref:glycosyltransferase n=1 Tax=Lactiplantibacillus plantarum TaxID=1590 RepID=UPI003D688338
MKILFLLKSHEYSGAENVILTLMQLLPAEYETYYASPDGPIRKTVRAKGQNFVALNKPNLKSVRSTIDKIKPDIIHASDFYMSVLATMAFSGIPIISHLHNNPTWIKNSLDPRTVSYNIALRKINKVICVSSSVIDEFRSKQLKNKSTVIPNIVDTNRIERLAIEDVSNSDSDLCLVGRLTSQKNPLFFCEIVKKIKEQKPNIRAIIVGRGELKDNIESFIKVNNLTGNLKLIGFKENPYPYMKGTKICVMPSKYEGFGLSAVEMLALRKPVIASNVGGLKDIINNDCGKLIDGFDADEYVETYFKLLEPEVYKKKSQGALLTSKKFANTKRFSANFMNIYMEALKCQN